MSAPVQGARCSSSDPVVLVPGWVVGQPSVALAAQTPSWEAITSAAAILSVERAGDLLAGRCQTHGRSCGRWGAAEGGEGEGEGERVAGWCRQVRESIVVR